MKKNEYPTKVNIVGIEYDVNYVDNPIEVDIEKRTALWGQIDPWTRKIRIFDNKRQASDVWQTLMHEVIHGILNILCIREENTEDDENKVDILAAVIVDTLIRNNMLKI